MRFCLIWLFFKLGKHQTSPENSYCNVSNVPENRAYLMNRAIADLQVQRCFCSSPGCFANLATGSSWALQHLYYAILSKNTSEHRICLQDLVNKANDFTFSLRPMRLVCLWGYDLFAFLCLLLFSFVIQQIRSISTMTTALQTHHWTDHKEKQVLNFDSWHKLPWFFYYLFV